MKYLIAFILYFLSASLFLGLCSLIWDGVVLYAIIFAVLIGWFFIFKNLHKFILVFLGAREIIDTDHQELFQLIKSSVYGRESKTPKIYSYNGSFKNCFLLESASEWIIVLDKKLLSDASGDVLSDLVGFLFTYHQKGHAFLKSKVLGLLVLYYQFLFIIFKNVFILKPGSKSFRILTLFFVFLSRPVTLMLEKLLTKQHRVHAGENLKPLFLQCEFKTTTEVFLDFHANKNPKINQFILDYVESFPILRECEFLT